MANDTTNHIISNVEAELVPQLWKRKYHTSIIESSAVTKLWHGTMSTEQKMKKGMRCSGLM